jgi:hypothetical protein
MSTRCVIKVKGKTSTLDIYHHHDGYPEGVGAELQKALSDGLLARIDAKEKNIYFHGFEFPKVVQTILEISDEYKITDGIHSDIEYLYTLDLNENTLVCQKGYYEDFGTKFVFVQADIIDLTPKFKD